MRTVERIASALGEFIAACAIVFGLVVLAGSALGVLQW